MPTIDGDLARLLLEICRYTYAKSAGGNDNEGDETESRAWISDHAEPLEIVELKGETDPTSVAFVLTYPDKNIVSYMGTLTEFESARKRVASLTDWVRDFQARPVPFQLTEAQLGRDVTNKDNLGGCVHEGFLEQLADVQAQVVQTLLANDGRNRQLYVTGHSQGAAEAALATRAFHAGGFERVETYTFAAPRPGDRQFAATIPPTIPVHRLEFGHDIVPHVPPMVLGREFDALTDYLSRLPHIADFVHAKLSGIPRHTVEFVGVGRLSYLASKTAAPRIELGETEEAVLYQQRLGPLLAHPEDWAEHHHLAGTTAQTHSKPKLRGNYTALVQALPSR